MSRAKDKTMRGFFMSTILQITEPIIKPICDTLTRALNKCASDKRIGIHRVKSDASGACFMCHSTTDNTLSVAPHDNMHHLEGDEIQE
jgi:hypothetical protein